MTAPSQAGAVAACPTCGAPCQATHASSGHSQWREYAHTPPAAVSVEALEGLVERLRNDTFGSQDAIAAELTTLIKERSNG